MAKTRTHQAPFEPYVLKSELQDDVEWLREDLYHLVKQRKEEIAGAIRKSENDESLRELSLFWDAYADAYKDFVSVFETRLGYAMRTNTEEKGDLQ